MSVGMLETTGTACLRCAGTNVIPAQLQHPLAFCVDQDAHHGIHHLRLRASLCRDCGHVEFRAAEPAKTLAGDETAPVGAIQEEDF